MIGDVVGDMGDDVVKIGRDEIAGEKAEVGEAVLNQAERGEVVGRLASLELKI